MGCPASSRPITNTASSSSSRKNASSAITKPRSGSVPRHSLAISLELGPQPGLDLAGVEHLGRVTGRLEPVHRLAHLADRPALEREGRDVDHRLVAVVDGEEPVAAVEVEQTLGRAEDRDPPVARAGEGDEAADERVQLARRADRIARHDRDAADDPVRDERPLVLAEEVRLVGAQHEGGERICSPGLDERAGELALLRLLPVQVPPRGQPGDEQPAGRGDPEQEHRDGEPVAEVAREVGRPVQVEPDESPARLVQREAEREGLVGHQAVDPQGRRPVGVDHREQERGAEHEAGSDGRVAGLLEVAAARDEPERDQRRHHCAVRVALEEMERRGGREQRDGELPRAPAPAGEAARGEDQREPERSHEGARDRIDRPGRERLEQ